jgi:hypothetical protein
MTGEMARWLRPLGMAAVCGGASVTLVVASTLVMDGAEVPAFLAHLTVAVLAAGAAYLLDDPAAEATAVVPRPLLRRRARTLLPGLAVVALAALLAAAVLHRWSPSLPLELLGWETAGLVGFTLAASAVAFRLGEAEPGNLVASLLPLLVLGVLIGQPALPVDLLTTVSADAIGAGWWGALAAISTLVLVHSSLAERLGSSARTRPGGATEERHLPVGLPDSGAHKQPPHLQ